MPIITANRDTKLTETPLDSVDPNVGAVFSVPSGQKLAIGFNKISQDINGKGGCEFEPHLTIRGQRWKKLYIFLSHWDGVGEVMRSKVATASTFSAAGSNKLLLPITHRDQNDNSSDTGQGPGWRQCALTSVVMFLEAMRGPEWLKQQSVGYQQPEDWYAAELNRRGFDTTDPQAHVRVLRARFGLRVQFRYDLSLAEAKDSIERGCGLVSGVRWSPSGHYQFAMGKHLTKGGLYYLDPYGKRGLTDTTALDYYVTIGGKQDPIYWPIPVIKDAWLDLGDRAGWGLWPEDGTYGFYYEKPQVTISAPQSTISKKITPADIDRAAAEIGVEPQALKAVMAVEANGSGFLPSGRCKILFEAQWFGYYSGDKHNQSHPHISSLKWNKSLYKGGEAEWARLEEAATLDKKAAYMSASYGIGQIMGFHWEALGYKSVFEFADLMNQSEGEQLLAMARFIKSNGLMLRALRNKQWADFAYHYNGEGYKANAYDTKLAKAFEQSL